MTTGPPGFSRLPPALRRPAVLDACSLLNLCAADPLLDDLAGLGARFHIVPQVRQEVLFLRGDGPGAPARVRVDIETAVQRGTLTQVGLSSQTETDLFLSLVGDGLHDGEAASAAVAASKGFSLLTDEAPARRVMATRKYEHLLLTSADVLKVWVASMGVDADTLREMIRRIEHRASFTIQRNHHLKPWWDQAAGRA